MLQRLNNKDFDKVYEVMEESFPMEEYRTYEEQKNLLNNPRYSIYVIKDENDHNVMAFICVWRFDQFAFIEHFAVNSKYRNQGLGSSILKELFQSLSCRICLEVELPNTFVAKRRIEFYKRNGFYMNEYPYIQPSISEGRKPLPLAVMTTQGGISKALFEEIKKVLYQWVYHVNDIRTPSA